MPTGRETSVMGLAMSVPNSDTTDIEVIIKKFHSFMVIFDKIDHSGSLLVSSHQKPPSGDR